LPGASMLRILIYHPVNLFWLRNIISTGWNENYSDSRISSLHDIRV
jgi:hypothetical protein